MPDPTRDYQPNSLHTADHSLPLDTRTFAESTGASGTETAEGSTPGAPPGYELREEVGHGGMGLVFRARHVAMNRLVALKFLHERFAADSPVARRFVEESLITGQLQHPAIPPVHEIGTLPNGRPYLAMKLILGRTLDELLRERAALDAERGRFVAVFEQICQGVGYAHANGIIHRDLKPANVMVGAFAEVQVMDWGLAKKVAGAGTEVPEASVSPSVVGQQSTLPGGDTQAGSVLGTPAYMPPEQAAGEIAKIDARSDVFGLGAVLCVILTGRPPYEDAGGISAREKAARGQLTDAITRLDACGAEPELVALCKRCLAVERDARPANANEVAAAVASLRAAAEARARQAELERARTELRTTEQRKRRRIQLALAGAIVLLLAAGGAFAWWDDRQASERKLADERAAADRERSDSERKRIEAEGKATEARLGVELAAEQRLKAEQERLKAEQARQGVTASLALAVDLRKQYRFKSAQDALTQAAELAKETQELLARVEQARRDLAFAIRLDDIRYSKWVRVVHANEESRDAARTSAPITDSRFSYRDYRTAFAQNRLELVKLDTDRAAARVADSSLKAELLAALEDWAIWEPEPALRAKLLDIARGADPGEPWTTRFRDAKTWASKDAMKQLAAEADPARITPASLSSLAVLLENHDLDPLPLLTVARAAHPSNFDLASAHARACKDRQQDQELGSYEAARALRPDNYVTSNNIGLALKARGNLPGAIATFRKALEIDPNTVHAYTNLGFVLHQTGDLNGSLAQYKKAVELKLANATLYNNLGFLLHDRKDFDGAIAAYEKASELDPKFAMPHRNRGYTLRAKGDLRGATAAYRKATELDPNDPNAFNNLGNALRLARDWDGAATALARAIELDSKHVLAHNNLGLVLQGKGDLKGALTYYAKALELNPKYAPAQHNIGWALKTKGDLDGAIVEYKKAIVLDPKQAITHYNLGGIYYDRREFTDAAACARAAVAVNPDHANAYALLGSSLAALGDIPGARAALTEAARLDKRWAPTLAQLPPLTIAPPPREVKK